MNRHLHIFAFVISLGVFFSISTGLAAQGPSEITIHYSDNKISANLANASLGDVLEDIHNKTGVEYQLFNSGLFELKVNATFRNLDLDEGLKKILSRVNNAIIYGPARKIRKVAVFNKLDKEFPISDPIAGGNDRAADSDPTGPVLEAAAATNSTDSLKPGDFLPNPKAGPRPLAAPSGQGLSTGPVPIAAEASDDKGLEGPATIDSPTVSALDGPMPISAPADTTEIQTNPDNTPMPPADDREASQPDANT